jgi:ABC-type uncharacterized transport system involved in gliding motility auxiliary subunit
METNENKNRIWKLSGGIAGLLVLLAILIAANVIIGGLRVRKDFTQERLYTLSDGTRSVLKKLDHNVTLKFFFSSSAPEVPGPLKTFAQQVEDLLHEYQLAGRGRIVVEKYDPKPDSDAEEWANRYGVEGQSMGPGGPNLYLGLVAVAGENQSALPVIDPRTEELLEYNITRMIHRVSAGKKPVVGIMSPLPVLGSQAMPYMMPGQPRPQPQQPWAAFQDLEQDYDVRSIPTTVDSILPDLDALVLIHPKDLSDRTLFAIDQFVLRGGRLLAFVDPFCGMDNESGEPNPAGYTMPNRSSNLNKLFTTWGITYDPAKIVADMDAATMLRGQGNRVVRSPLYLTLRAANISRRDAMTAPLDSLLMPMAGAFTGDGAAGITVTPLVMTSDRSDLTEAMMAQMNPEMVMRNLKSGLKKMALAVRLEGTFKTAFPQGQPAGEPPPSPDPTQPPPAPANTNASHLAQSTTTGHVILVGDVDMLGDEFTVQSLDFLGYTARQPINDNINFLANAVEQLSGSADLIGIRCRGRSARPFTRVLALERDAQQRWLEEERGIEEKLQTTQQRMSELQQQKDEKQRFILSPEQAKEVERFRKEVADYRQQLKQVRRNLREGIENLGVTVKVINILLMPALVSVAGVSFALIRRRRH